MNKIIEQIVLGAASGLIIYLFFLLLKWIKGFFGNKQE